MAPEILANVCTVFAVILAWLMCALRWNWLYVADLMLAYWEHLGHTPDQAELKLAKLRREYFWTTLGYCCLALAVGYTARVVPGF